ncbi:hypothetical protein ACFQU7_16715 [Pseudoroseomonas wenyumeiae]
MTNPFDIFREQPAVSIMVLTILVIYVTMVYGPIAAALVELSPRASATPPCRCPTISATAGSAVCCRRPPSP